MNLWAITGLVLIVILILAVSLLSARKATDADNFTTAGGKANAMVVAGIIMTSLVGGQSTIGTAQLAFSYGISAWWFTIGAALGCLLLALGYGKALRRSGCTTLLQVVGQTYGARAESVGSILCFVGIFISIVAQILSSSAMMTGLFGMGSMAGALVSVALMMLMVVMGGVWGAGYSGLLKAVLLYLSAVVAGVLVLTLSHGYGSLHQDIVANTVGQPYGDALQLYDAEEVHRRFGSLVARGFMKDVGGGLSLMLGVVATQTYAQGIWAARSHRAAVRGGLLCAFLTPLIGAGCTLAGLYMRAHYVTADEAAAVAAAHAALPHGVQVLRHTAEAFPVFCLDHMPPLIAGIVLGTLFLTVIGGGAGLALGSATILVRDVYGHLRRAWRRLRGQAMEEPQASTLRELRLTIVGILLIGILFTFTNGKAFINDLGFLSLGLRATAVLLPLTAALYMPGRCTPRAVLCSMLAGTVMLLVAQMTALPGAPIYWGLAAAILALLPGLWRTRTA